ncbi:MAG: C25 family cysteine peptidase [candidate division WOR-3 bacterium]
MKQRLFCLFFLLGFVFYSLAGWSGSFRFSPDLFALTTTTAGGENWTLLTFKPSADLSQKRLTTDYLQNPGRPILPYCFFTIVIPQGMKVTDVNVEVERFVSLRAPYPPYPAQHPVPVSQRDLPEFVKPDPAVYANKEPWPERLYEISPVGIKSGFRLVTVSLYPVKFDPVTNSYLVATRLRVNVDYGFDATAEEISLTPKQVKVFSQGVKTLVANPEDVERFAPQKRETDFGTYDYVVITNATLAPYFQRLVNWRTRTGYSGIVRTTSWINSNYSGRDLQEKIRNFIRDYYTNQGTMWVLLGGDNAIVPARRARTYCNSDTGNIPCDLYYGDLQWSWDSDHDSIFGEYGEDTTDLYYDVYIGRASVDDTTQVKTFVNKVITHETSPPTGYLRRILLVDDSLWSGYAYRQSNESIASITPSGWSDVFIHEPGNTTMVRDSLNNGFQFSHMVGHGNETGIYHTMPPPTYAFYSNSVIGGHNNGSRVGLINSIACHPGNFEYSDCLAESTHNWSNGGALAVIMNSRYGWGTPPVIGPSERLDVRFYDFFFNHDTMPIGLTHSESKEVYRNLANGGNGAWRWCYFELNLFGDPLLLMYEEVPAGLNATFTSPINTGSQNFTVRVLRDTLPVAGALVCVHKGSEVYARNYTNSSGEVTFSINPTTPGYMYVTATKPNYLPDVDSCQVVSSEVDVGVMRIVAPKGTVDSGSAVTPRAVVKNYVSVPVSNVPVRLRIGSSYDDTAVVGYIAGQDTAVVEFDTWEAHPSGNVVVRCSTMLAGDTYPANNCLTETVFVRYRDVGTVSVSVPAEVDSGDIVSPVATVRNYGNTTETFNCRLVITGTGYEQTRSKTLTPGTQDTVIFPNWTALARGSHTARCSTQLTGDQNTANDRGSANVFVRVRDAGSIQIVSPVGNVDSAGTLPVRARVRNYGNTTESFYVHFRIAGPSSYYDSALVNALGPGESTLVSFTDWSCGPRGNYTTACSTALAGDMQPANNRIGGSFSVIIHDIAATGIVRPGAQVDSGGQVDVKVAVENKGSAQESAKVFVRIGSYYQESTKVAIAAGVIDTVTLAFWQVNAPRGSVVIYCSTAVNNDVNPSNDTLSRVTEVIVHDVAVIGIIAPKDTVDSGSVVAPQARIRNLGSVTDSFNCRFTISDGYVAQMILNLIPGADSVITFPNWVALRTGSWTTKCTTLLTLDRQPGNNHATGTVFVAGTDVGVAAILAPVGEVDPGPNTPRARVGNYSATPKSFKTYLSITPDSGGTPIFLDSVLVENLAPDSLTDVVFSTWDATSGRYLVRCSTGLSDCNPVNDTLSTHCRVVLHDMAVVSVSPQGEMRPLPVSPIIRIRNVGEATETGKVYLLIVDSVRGNQAYFDSVGFSGVGEGEMREIRLPIWQPTGGYYHLSAYTVVAGDVNPANDTCYARLHVWSQAAGWQRRKDIPSGLRRVKYGGALAGMPGGSGKVYALKGNKSFEFYAYDPNQDSWLTLPPIPALPSNRAVYKSGAMCSDQERYIYATKGNNTLEFWRYDIQNDTWEQLADVPAGLRTLKRGGTGLAYVRVGDSSYVFCLKGCNTFEFYAYSVERNEWQPKAQAPAAPSGKRFKAGSALCSFNQERIFALKSYSNELYEYVVASDTWINKSPLPNLSLSGRRSRCRDGAALTSDDIALLYAFTGGSQDFFYAYNVTTDNWLELEPLPLSETGRHVKAGAALAHLSNNIYALRGNATNEFYVYLKDTIALLTPQPERSGVAGNSVAPNKRNGLLIVPNPAKGTVRFVFYGQAPAQLNLYSSAGQVVAKSTLLPGKESCLDITKIPAGVYLARVSTKTATTTQKVVVR